MAGGFHDRRADRSFAQHVLRGEWGQGHLLLPSPRCCGGVDDAEADWDCDVFDGKVGRCVEQHSVVCILHTGLSTWSPGKHKVFFKTASCTLHPYAAIFKIKIIFTDISSKLKCISSRYFSILISSSFWMNFLGLVSVVLIKQASRVKKQPILEISSWSHRLQVSNKTWCRVSWTRVGCCCSQTSYKMCLCPW